MVITVVVKEPFKPFEIRQIENHLQSYYKVIDTDCIGISSLSSDAQMIYADDYLFNGSHPNLKYRDPRMDHIICGNVIFMRMDNEGDGIDMTQEEAEHLKRWLEILFHSFTEEEAKKINPEDYAGVTIITF